MAHGRCSPQAPLASFCVCALPHNVADIAGTQNSERLEDQHENSQEAQIHPAVTVECLILEIDEPVAIKVAQTSRGSNLHGRAATSHTAFTPEVRWDDSTEGILQAKICDEQAG